MQPEPSAPTGQERKAVAYCSGSAASVARQQREINEQCARMGFEPISPSRFFCDIFDDESDSEEEAETEGGGEAAMTAPSPPSDTAVNGSGAAGDRNGAQSSPVRVHPMTDAEQAATSGEEADGELECECDGCGRVLAALVATRAAYIDALRQVGVGKDQLIAALQKQIAEQKETLHYIDRANVLLVVMQKANEALLKENVALREQLRQTGLPVQQQQRAEQQRHQDESDGAADEAERDSTAARAA